MGCFRGREFVDSWLSHNVSLDNEYEIIQIEYDYALIYAHTLAVMNSNIFINVKGVYRQWA